jgi:hypothetical protein
VQRAYWWAIYALFITLLVGFVSFSLVSDRHHAYDDAQQRLATLAGVIEQHAVAAVATGELILSELALQGAAWDWQDEGGARRLTDTMRRLVEKAPQVSSAWFVYQ